MLEAASMSATNLLAYLSCDELSQLDEIFSKVLGDTKSLVFWTGVSSILAKDWANSNNLKTLAIAMGALYCNNEPGTLRYRKSPKAWSKYMKGASGLFVSVMKDAPEDTMLFRPKYQPTSPILPLS